MASPWVIVAGLAAGGVALYFYEKKKQQQQQSPSECKAICKATLSGDEEKACELACDAAGYIPDPFHDSVGDRQAAITKGDQGNLQLNGDVELYLPEELQHPPALSQSGGVQTMDGSVLRFKKGCVPFKGAPGWEKCKPGTQSMWSSDTDVDQAYNHGALPAFANDQLLSVWVDHHDTGSPLDDATKAATLSGNANEDHPDVTTQGPFPAGRTFGVTKNTPGTKVPTGSEGWIVRGKPMICPQGQAPDLWDESGLPRALSPGEEITCVPDGRHRSGAGTGTGGGVSTGEQTIGHGTFVHGDCPPPQGFTWDVSSAGLDYLRRLRAGEAPKCKRGTSPSSSPSSSSSSPSSTRSTSTSSSSTTNAVRLTPHGFG